MLKTGLRGPTKRVQLKVSLLKIWELLNDDRLTDLLPLGGSKRVRLVITHDERSIGIWDTNLCLRKPGQKEQFSRFLRSLSKTVLR